MPSDDTFTAATPSHVPTNKSVDAVATAGAVGTALTNAASLPQAFEQYPKGGATVAFLVIVALLCWVVVTWLNNRRS